MAVREINPEEKRERRRFVSFERELLGHEPLFVAEIESDVDERVQGRSPFYEEIDHALFMASNGADVARCAAFVNRRWQRDRDPDAGFIGYFAAAPEAQAEVAELLAAAEAWLAERGIKRVIAPYNGAMMLGGATQTDAFDEDPVFPFPWQPPHYPGMLEAAGYRPTYPFWIYDVDFASERYRLTAQRALDDPRCEVRTVDKRRWKQEIELFRDAWNDTFGDEWEFHAMTSAEFHDVMDDFKPVLDRQQLLFAEVDGEVAGFCLGFPDYTPLWRSFKGKLGPLQIVRLMLRAKSYRRAGLIAIGVRDAYRGLHIGQTLAATLYRRYEELGLRRAFYYPVNDHNLASRRLAESFGGEGRILYHCYDKQLASG